MKRKLFNVILIVVMTLSLTVTVFAKPSEAGLRADNLKSYVVIMKGDAVVNYEGDVAQFKATKPVEGKKINPNARKVKEYQNYLDAKHSASLEAAGASALQKVHDYTVALNGYSAIITEEQAKSIAAQSDVVLVLEDVMRYADTDSSPKFLGLTGKGNAWAKGWTGEGVIVGVIDSGIWPEHPSFADDGSYPPAPPLDNSRPNCEFGNTAHNANDAPFECNNKLIGARQMLDTYRALIGATPDEYDSARDDNGHGTHTASTAAGNRGVEASIYGIPRGKVSGIAPRAHVVAYKGLGNLGGFTSDLAAAIDQAVFDGVDVINYSIGGGASGPGADEIAFLFAADAGVHVATSAGNSGPGAATLGNPGTMPWMTTVGASTQPRFWQGTVILGDGAAYEGASITPGVGSAPLVDAEVAGGDLCVPGTLDPTAVTGKIVLCRRGAIARAAKSEAVFLAGGVGMVMYENTDDNSLFSDTHWVPSVHIDNTPGLAVKAYIASDANPTAEIVGEQVSTWPSAPSMTYFSSRGPNPVSPDLIKPDITAPGIQILAGNSPTPIGGYPGELFQAIAGTSMSSPHIAGVFALLDQAHPDWSPAMAKSAIMTTAYQDVVDNDRVSPADPFDYGSGHVDVANATRKNSAFRPGLVYNAGLFEYAAYTCGEDFGVFTQGSCDFLESIGVPSEPYNLNVPSIGVANLAGSQTVVRTVTAAFGHGVKRSFTFQPVVEAPPGFKVSVSPASLVLANGESASYEVTITNVSAPSGEWRFGSLTWQGLGYSVYSPIAVNAAPFAAPSEIFSSGESGSASFDVSFGYNGSYAAAPHGLAADEPTDGEIGQDPDQTYPSADDSPVGVQRITFPITGAAFVRWEMIIPGDDDIDLFLEDSSGTIVAASTSGGTDELIELTLPADDTYTMVVHGWSVPNEPLPYTLHFWQVPLASGGSLNLDSAPTSAEIGVTGSVDVSWSGLAEGRYLGAVSHTGDVGLMGLTLVNVDVAAP
jgi:subtilisin family serine protease